MYIILISEWMEFATHVTFEYENLCYNGLALYFLPPEDLESASSVASAFGVGRLESGAAVNLLTKVPETIREGLKEAVRRGRKNPYSQWSTEHISFHKSFE